MPLTGLEALRNFTRVIGEAWIIRPRSEAKKSHFTFFAFSFAQTSA